MIKSLLMGGVVLSIISLIGKAIAFARDISVARSIGFVAELDNYILLFALAMLVISVVSGALNSVYASFVRRHKLHFSSFYRQFAIAATLLNLLFTASLFLLLPRFMLIEPSSWSVLAACFAIIAWIGLLQAPLIASLTAKKDLVFLGLCQLLMPCSGLVVVTLNHYSLMDLAVVGIAFALLLAYLSHYLLLLVRAKTHGIVIVGGDQREAVTATPSANLHLFQEMSWLIAGSSLLALLPIVDIGFANQLGDGQVSILNNAYKFIAVLQSVLAMSFGSLLIPIMADWLQHPAQLKNNLRKVLIGAFFVGGAVSLVLFAGLPWLISALFTDSKVGLVEQQQVTAIANAYLLLIPLYLTGMVLSRCLVSVGKARLMLYINAIALSLNIVFDYLMSQWVGLIGIAFTTSIVYLFSVLALLYCLQRELIDSSRIPKVNADG